MEGYAPPETWTCNDCLLAGQWRCRDCFGGVVLCRGCCRRRHERLPFHQQEIWTGSFFTAAFLWEAGLRLYLGHNGDPCPEFHHNHEVWQREQETLDLGDQQVDRSGAENGMDVDDAAGESINRPRMAEDVIESGPSNAGATEPAADAENDTEPAADAGRRFYFCPGRPSGKPPRMSRNGWMLMRIPTQPTLPSRNLPQKTYWEQNLSQLSIGQVFTISPLSTAGAREVIVRRHNC
jgi:hypothetical protein